MTFQRVFRVMVTHPRQVVARLAFTTPLSTFTVTGGSSGVFLSGVTQVPFKHLESPPHDLACAFKAPIGRRQLDSAAPLLGFTYLVCLPSSGGTSAIPSPNLSTGSASSCHTANRVRSRGFAPPQRFSQRLLSGLLHPDTRYGVRHVSAFVLRIAASPKTHSTRRNHRRVSPTVKTFPQRTHPSKNSPRRQRVRIPANLLPSCRYRYAFHPLPPLPRCLR